MKITNAALNRKLDGAYNRGLKAGMKESPYAEGFEDGIEASEDAFNAGFDEGYKQGFDDSMTETDEDGTLSYTFEWTEKGAGAQLECTDGIDSDERRFTLTFDDDGDKVRLTQLTTEQLEHLQWLIDKTFSEIAIKDRKCNRKHADAMKRRNSEPKQGVISETNGSPLDANAGCRA